MLFNKEASFSPFFLLLLPGFSTFTIHCKLVKEIDKGELFPLGKRAARILLAASKRKAYSNVYNKNKNHLFQKKHRMRMGYRCIRSRGSY